MDKHTADQQWDDGEFEVFETVDDALKAMYENGFENDKPPERIWLQWYQDVIIDYEPEINAGSEPCYVAAHPDERTYSQEEPVNWHDVEYIRADIVAAKDAEIERLQNIIADMAAREVDAAQRLEAELGDVATDKENYGALLLEFAIDEARISGPMGDVMGEQYYTGSYMLDRCLGIMTTDDYFRYLDIAESGLEKSAGVATQALLALARNETFTLNVGEALWTCDGCGQRGIVPADWKWVPGWDWDEIKRDGRWYCMGCQERMGWLAAEERTDD